MRTDYKSRLLIALAALVLIPIYLTPVWSIKLVAPQYPDGMGMYIGVSEVWGHDDHDIQNINILNHYIGMQEIHPDSIPELEIFPIVLLGIILTGLAVAIIGQRWLMAAWLVGFVGLCIAGMVDFYLWMIDYGHNLSPDAPIKIPGMTYTPPLIGTKQLLNITASSFPHIGSAFLGLSLGLAGWGVFRSFRKRKSGPVNGKGSSNDTPVRPRALQPVAVAVVAALIVLTGCVKSESSPKVLNTTSQEDVMVYGESEDPYCGERVERIRWGGELRTTEGDILRFRSTECLAAYLLDGRVSKDKIASLRVVDFPDSRKLIDVREARFLHTPNLASPTGLNLMAIETDKMARNLQDAYSGPIVGWDDVLEIVSREWNLNPATALASAE
jgi:copper chaperone NosL